MTASSDFWLNAKRISTCTPRAHRQSGGKASQQHHRDRTHHNTSALPSISPGTNTNQPQEPAWGNPAACIAADPAEPTALATAMQWAKQGWSHSPPCNSSSPTFKFHSLADIFISLLLRAPPPLHQAICLVLLALPPKALARQVVNKTLLPPHCLP